MDRLGDVLLSGPAVRAVAGGADSVTFLASPSGAAAARLLPGVDRVVVQRAGWIEDPAPPVTDASARSMVEAIRRLDVDEALVLTSFHQSPLPLALLLRMAGVPRIGAVSVDYPGALLDVRHHVDDEVHEVRRALSLAQAMGHQLPVGDAGRLQVHLPHRDVPRIAPGAGYVVVHPGTSVPARAWSPASHGALVGCLAARGWRVFVTGGPAERALTSAVAAPGGVDLGGRLDLAELAHLVKGAAAIVVANTGPAHLAAAVGTPVVSLYAPTVPAVRWRPWMVPHVLLGQQDIPCAGCRARACPVPGHPCLDHLHPEEVAEAVERLARPAVAVPAPMGGGPP